MYYALFDKQEVQYEKDKDGNLIVDYVDADGNEYYRDSGAKIDVYKTPVKFCANIRSKLDDATAMQYGIDQSALYAEIAVAKGELPITYGTKIWKTSEIKWLDDEHTLPDADSADYTVMGVLNEFLDYDRYYLKKIVKEK